MRYINIIWFVLFLTSLVTSCDTWEDDLNVDPSYPTEGGESDEDYDYDPGEFMLDMTYCTVKGWDYIHWNVGSSVCEYHGKTISLSQGNRHRAWHAFDDAANGGPWESGYDAVRYILKMREAAESNGDEDYQAIADIWECYNFFNLTLLYGDIPYSESISDETITQPVYDSQKDIYFTLMHKLKAAGLSIDPSGSIDSETDLIYSGNLEKWKRFANTLLIRYAMYMYDNEEAQDSATTYLNEILNDQDSYPVMESNAQNAYFNYDGVNYYSRYYLLDPAKFDEAPFSNVFIERLSSINDPRLPIYAKPVSKYHTDSSKNVLPSNYYKGKKGYFYAGHIYGITTDNAYATAWNDGSNYASKLGTYFHTEDESGNNTVACADVPMPLATYSEMLFFLAEATERGIIATGTTAQDYYEQAIQASFDQYGVDWSDDDYTNAFGDSSLSSIDDYIDQQQVSYTGGRDPLTLIAEQKWIASFLMMFEPYFDHRRTMLPAWRSSSGAEASYWSEGSGSKFPSRAAYPTSEATANAENYADARANGYDIAITNTETRNEALMWVLQSHDQEYLQMPTFEEPSYKSEYPCTDDDSNFGTEFYTWYTENYNNMFWWLNEDED